MRQKTQRPPQKLFNEDNIRAIGGEINHDGDFLIFEGARYSRKGYLYRTLKMEKAGCLINIFTTRGAEFPTCCWVQKNTVCKSTEKLATQLL